MQNRRFDGRLPEMSFPIKDIYQDMHPELVIMKAAQIGISEYGINLVLWGADVGWADRGVCLYVFPKQEQMDDFSQDRINRAINQSSYLKQRMGHTDRSDNANRTRLRKLGGRPIYFRGSDSPAQTRSVDADVVVLDEVDLFKEGSVARMKERLGSSMNRLFRAFSQPLYPNGPVDMLYKQSDQRRYQLQCEGCNTWQALEWNSNIEFTVDLTKVRIICNNPTCKKPMDRLGKGRWVPMNPEGYSHGYQLSKLYSPRADLLEILRKSLNVADSQDIQSFYNGDLGVPHRPDGTPGLEDFDLDEYPWENPLRECFMGVDTGKQLHTVVIGRDNQLQDYRLLYRASVKEFSDLDKIKERFSPRMTVVDGQGEPRATQEWIKKHGDIWAWYHRPAALDPDFHDRIVYYHRTAMLDLLYSALKAHLVKLHVSMGTEFKTHLENNIKEVIQDHAGRWVARYTPIGPDHYAFALVFAILGAGLRATGAFQGVAIGKTNYRVETEFSAGVILDGDAEDDPDTGPLWKAEGTGSKSWSSWRPFN